MTRDLQISRAAYSAPQKKERKKRERKALAVKPFRHTMVVFHFRILRSHPGSPCRRNCSRTFMIAHVRMLSLSGVIKRSNYGFLGNLTERVNLE